MRKTTRRIFFAFTLLGLATFSIAQRPQTAGDTTRPGGQRSAAGVRPYREIITDKAISKNGFFKVHKVEEKYYFDSRIPFERNLLRLPAGRQQLIKS